jgi:hypothetical protein
MLTDDDLRARLQGHVHGSLKAAAALRAAEAALAHDVSTGRRHGQHAIVSAALHDLAERRDGSR